jgi:pimeloyl-ACP methyl ester carboxylesterase
MIPTPVSVVEAKAAMTLRSDTNPVPIKVNKPRGTVYWGGAGLDGAYIPDQAAALQEAGIKYVYVGNRTYGIPVDTVRAGLTVRYRDSPVDEDWHIKGMEDNSSSQFNMIGYSYGSLLAAQTANFYAYNGHIVDNLVLVGSPVDEDFLVHLKKQKNIRNVIIKNLEEYDDPIFAGISQFRLLLSLIILLKQKQKTENIGEGFGHFYYASPSTNGARRRRNLAEFIYRQGLR